MVKVGHAGIANSKTQYFPNYLKIICLLVARILMVKD
jgi:hypothetical protein